MAGWISRTGMIAVSSDMAVSSSFLTDYHKIVALTLTTRLYHNAKMQVADTPAVDGFSGSVPLPPPCPVHQQRRISLAVDSPGRPPLRFMRRCLQSPAGDLP